MTDVIKHFNFSYRVGQRQLTFVTKETDVKFDFAMGTDVIFVILITKMSSIIFMLIFLNSDVDLVML